MVMVNVCIEMHLYFHVRAVEIVFGAYVMQIILLCSFSKDPGKYSCKLR
jgi:hypothetical protein